MEQNHAKAVEEANKELELNQLKERISQLESEKAELQRVVQVKDEALLACRHIVDHVVEDSDRETRSLDEIYQLIEKAVETTPKDLPAFIPEEEYLRVKEELETKKVKSVQLIGEFLKLKSHAEAMADCLKNNQYGTECLCISCSVGEYSDTPHRDDCEVDEVLGNYRKDFPK